MENLNAEEIKCGLEHCTAKSYKCEECPYFYKSEGLKSSMEILMTDALALITEQEQNKEKLGLLIDEVIKEKRELFEENKRLTEENERLKAQKYYIHSDGSIEMIPTVEAVRADTVRKMQEGLQAYFGTYVLGYKIPITEALKAVNKIAEEMIGGDNNG